MIKSLLIRINKHHCSRYWAAFKHPPGNELEFFVHLLLSNIFIVSIFHRNSGNKARSNSGDCPYQQTTEYMFFSQFYTPSFLLIFINSTSILPLFQKFFVTLSPG